jgi:hypothetical protein
VLVDKTMCRESLYVAMSRGRLANRAYIVTDESLEVDLHVLPGPRLDGLTVLRAVLAREGSERSATETLRDILESAESLAILVPRYLDALTRATLATELEEAVRAGLRDAGGRALEHRAAQAPGWRQLLMACAGQRPRELVAGAVSPGSWTRARCRTSQPCSLGAWPFLVTMTSRAPTPKGRGSGRRG